MARIRRSSAKKALATATTVANNPPTQQVPMNAFENLWRSQRKRSMSGGALLGTAFESLQVNRLRSFLTILGVIIGVSAVITVVTLSQGVNQSISQRFASLGTNVITISPGAATTGGALSAAGSKQTLTLGDANAVAGLPHVVNASPLLVASGQVIYGSQNWNTTIRGVYPNYQSIQDWQIAEGAWFSDEAEQTSAPVAVIGQTVVQNLFTPTNTDPIGQTIRINSQLFRVVATLQAKGSQGFSNSDDVIFVPFSAANERLKPSPLYVDQIQLQVDDVNNVAVVQQNITALLRVRHHLGGATPTQSQQSGKSGVGTNPLAGLGGSNAGGRQGGGNFGGRGTGNPNGGQQTGGTSTTGNSTSIAAVSDPNDFQVQNGSQLVQTAEQSTAELTILLIGIAAISLTVGGIGIMNIMLVSVTERTREIGISMAIGARQRDIRNQFLLEALMLSILGGLIGILIGLLGGIELTRGLGFPFVFNPISMALAFTVSAIVGICFGFYPAVRAAKLDPIVALRTD
ncbi:MAG TPA: ABC transporter permease [Ktedonobacteraceae bacterium]|nr:ABC transporter permease [Ktedonobacteraceae bacterium]